MKRLKSGFKKRERSLLYSKFSEKIKKQFPDCFYYKIPDTFGIGGKRPFDAHLLINGVAFAIEFKSKGDFLQPYQKALLAQYSKAGGFDFVFTDGDDMDVFINRIKKLSERR